MIGPVGSPSLGLLNLASTLNSGARIMIRSTVSLPAVVYKHRRLPALEGAADAAALSWALYFLSAS